METPYPGTGAAAYEDPSHGEDPSLGEELHQTEDRNNGPHSNHDSDSDHSSNNSRNPHGLGIPSYPDYCSSKEILAIISCALSATVAFVIVFEPRVAVYWGQTRQFVWIGLCLTLMNWCTQLPVKRLLLISSLNSRTSTLQSMDAILRGDPLATRAALRVQFFLGIMLALGPALSAAYKSLGGGESQYSQSNMIGQFSVTSPLGEDVIGYGLSQFFNATLPWFIDPGLSNRLYGFNMHVATENVSAMLDGPTTDYVESLRESLKPTQFKVITATVPAIVCEWNAQLDHSIQYYKHLWTAKNPNTSDPISASTWTTFKEYHLGMLMPVESDNTKILIANWDDNFKETNVSHLRQYSLSRQNYTGSWRVSQSSVDLVNAIPTYQKVDDHCLLRSNWLDIPLLYITALAEYDWRYRGQNESFYQENIKSDSTLLASVVWSRIAALAPSNVIELTPNPRCEPEGLPELPYETNVMVETVAMAIQPGWEIAVVLALYPLILLTSLTLRILIWPRSPIGEGFGLISLLASVEMRSLALLKGAGFSGVLSRPVFVGLSVNEWGDNSDVKRAGKITSSFEIEELGSEKLERKVNYI